MGFSRERSAPSGGVRSSSGHTSPSVIHPCRRRVPTRSGRPHGRPVRSLARDGGGAQHSPTPQRLVGLVAESTSDPRTGAGGGPVFGTLGEIRCKLSGLRGRCRSSTWCDSSCTSGWTRTTRRSNVLVVAYVQETSPVGIPPSRSNRRCHARTISSFRGTLAPMDLLSRVRLTKTLAFHSSNQFLLQVHPSSSR